MFSGNFVTFYRVPFLETIDPNFRPAVKMKMNFFSENQLNGLHWFLYKRNICLRRRCFVCTDIYRRFSGGDIAHLNLRSYILIVQGGRFFS